MRRLEDTIKVAMTGGIGSNKHVLRQKAEEDVYKEILLTSLEGNFWVPSQLTCIEEKRNELFGQYSSFPEKYALVYQISKMAERLEQHKIMEEKPGIVIAGQPLEIDRIFAEANRENIGENFPTYTKIFSEVSRIVNYPDIMVYCRLKPEDVGIAQARLKKTGRPEEQKFVKEPSYLIKVFELFEKSFTNGKRKNVIEIDASDLEENNSPEYFQRVFTHIAEKIREFKKPPRLSLDHWETIDHNQAQEAERRGRRQLIKYLTEHQEIITLAGLVGIGKTGTAEIIADRLNLEIMKELGGRNDEVVDKILDNFLRDKRTHCYSLQDSLIPKRTSGRKEFYKSGKSHIEDRSPEEDQVIFWRRFHKQSYLTDEQLADLKIKAKEAYAQAPKSSVLIKLNRPAHDCLRLILERGRVQEIDAWPLEELKAMEILYQDFFTEMEQYNSHDGPKIELDMQKFNPSNSIHQGYLWQEMFLGLLDYEKR